MTRSQRADVARHVLEEVYDRGGADAFALSVNLLVLEGKLTPAQGKMVKDASRKSYAELLNVVDSYGKIGKK